jgi:hypothetical protein
MKAISHFLQIAVLGGVLFLTPIVVLVFILGKAFDFARRGLKPVTAIIPDSLVSGAPTRAILAIIIAILCFLAGLFARTRPAQRIIAELESSVLSKVPAHEYLKQAGASAMGLGEMAESSGRARTTGRRLADRSPDRRGGRRVGRAFRPRFPEPDVGIGLSRGRQQRPPGQRSPRHRYGLPQACGAGSEAFLSELTPGVPTA